MWAGGKRWCAEGETRTLTGVRPRRPEHRVSANSTTSASVTTQRAIRERPRLRAKPHHEQREHEKGDRCANREIKERALYTPPRCEHRLGASKDTAQARSLGLEQDQYDQEDGH